MFLTEQAKLGSTSFTICRLLVLITLRQTPQKHVEGYTILVALLLINIFCIKISFQFFACKTRKCNLKLCIKIFKYISKKESCYIYVHLFENYCKYTLVINIQNYIFPINHTQVILEFISKDKFKTAQSNLN